MLWEFRVGKGWVLEFMEELEDADVNGGCIHSPELVGEHGSGKWRSVELV
jgi:hypothetical protein